MFETANHWGNLWADHVSNIFWLFHTVQLVTAKQVKLVESWPRSAKAECILLPPSDVKWSPSGLTTRWNRHLSRAIRRLEEHLHQLENHMIHPSLEIWICKNHLHLQVKIDDEITATPPKAGRDGSVGPHQSEAPFTCDRVATDCHPAACPYTITSLCFRHEQALKLH